MKYLILIILLSVNVPFTRAQDEGRNKKNARIAYNSAVEAITHGNYQEASLLLTKSLSDDPTMTEAMLTHAKVKIEMGLTDKAVEDFKALIDQNPDVGEYWFYDGYLAFEGVPDSSVLQSFNKAASLGYNTPQLFYYRGLQRFLSEDYQGAVSDFTKTIEMDNNNYQAYHDRASAKRLLGDLQGALYDFRMSTDLYHDNPVAFNNMGSVKIILGDFEGAIQDYSVAINLDGEFVIAYNNRGAANYYLGNLEEAMADFSYALNLDESYIPAIINKASVLTKDFHYIEAITLYDGVLNNSPDNGIAWLNRGLVKELTGDLTGACEDWKMAFLNGIKEAENFIKECK